jgi:phage-related protein (TIGR01555 family)
MWDRLIAYDSATSGIAQLVYKAHLRTLSIDGFRDILGGSATAMKGVVKNINMIRAMQTNEGLSVLDAKDKFEAHQFTFSGLDNVLIQFGEQLSGATEIPLVRLFGQSPAGFSTGDVDVRNYYDTIKQKQQTNIADPMELVYHLHYRSTFGQDPPKVFELSFRHLWQMSETENAEVTDKTTGAVTKAYDSGILSQKTALQELKALSRVTGVYNNITDKEINNADDEPAPSPNDSAEQDERLRTAETEAKAKPGAQNPAGGAKLRSVAAGDR